MRPATALGRRRPLRLTVRANHPRLRRLGRRLYHRSSLVRRLAAAARLPMIAGSPPDLAHLALFSETPHGPIQADEALFLYSLVRMIRPQTVLEIGFLKGDSAFNFLQALDRDARLYSVDVKPQREARARELFGHDSRFAFRVVSQDQIARGHIDGRLADLVFLDASHDLALNQATFARLLDVMAPNAVLAVHDTGSVPRSLVPRGHWWLHTDVGWVGDEREVLPEEREFVNWVRESHPEFSEIHLHSRRTLRLGMTLFQRSRPLPRSG